MTDSLGYNSRSTYYRHSGRFSAPGLVRALLLGCLVAVPLGAAYAYVDLYNPIAGWITFLVTGGTGLIMGKVLDWCIKNGKIRNVPVAMLTAGIASILLFISCWEFWLYALLQRGGIDVPILDLLTHPGAAWDTLMEVNAVGAWSLKGTTPTGIFLGLIWLIEAVLLLGIPLYFAWAAVHEAPFCEQCNKWCGTRELIRLQAGDKSALRAKLEARDFSALADLGVAPSSSLQFWSAYFQGCADCDTTQTLCIDAFTLSYDKNGKLQTKKSPIITRLLLTPDDTVAVATAAAMLSAPPAPDPAPEPAASPAASDAPESAGLADAIAESPGQDPSSPPAAV